jgi:hypothetical protein
MILHFTRHPNKHRLTPMQIGFVLRSKNTGCGVSFQQRISRIGYDTFYDCAGLNKQIGLFSSLIGRIKTQIPIGRFLNKGLR